MHVQFTSGWVAGADLGHTCDKNKTIMCRLCGASSFSTSAPPFPEDHEPVHCTMDEVDQDAPVFGLLVNTACNLRYLFVVPLAGGSHSVVNQVWWPVYLFCSAMLSSVDGLQRLPKTSEMMACRSMAKIST